MPYNYLDKAGLEDLWAKIKGKFVVQVPGKGLSTNDLTDELKQKILDAGDSNFDGQYTSLTGKPSIEGHELASGNQTAASLGLATPSDISTATEDMATQTWVTEKGYQNSTQVQQAITTATTDMATQTWVTGRGYATTSALTSATADMATKTWVEGKGYATTTNVNTLINQAVSTVYTPKGSLANISTLTTLATSGKVGDVYNISSEFTTTNVFIEGIGKKYPAGTNIVLVEVEGAKKWDVLAGSVDLSAYVKSSEMVAITDTEIDEICV